jgi:hypothetical protein
MGTSAKYDAPPAWSDLKGDITRAAGGGPLSAQVAGNIVRSFIRHNGGVGVMARTGSASGSSGSVASGRAARATAGRLSGFVAGVADFGLEQALRNAGWSDLVGRPVREILAALLDRLGGEASTIDDVDARMALAQLQAKYFAAAETSDELEALLAQQVAKIEIVLQDFFGLYLYEVFCRVFFERLVQRVGETRSYAFLDQIRGFIIAALANRAIERDLSGVDWGGPEGAAITSEIMEATLSVFG